MTFEVKTTRERQKGSVKQTPLQIQLALRQDGEHSMLVYSCHVRDIVLPHLAVPVHAASICTPLMVTVVSEHRKRASKILFQRVCRRGSCTERF